MTCPKVCARNAETLDGLLRQQVTGFGEARRDRKASVVQAVQENVHPLVKQIEALKGHVEQLNNSCMTKHADTAVSLWQMTYPGTPLLPAPPLDTPPAG